MSIDKFRFHEVARAPQDPGIYAWYCHHEIPTRNIEDVLADLKKAPSYSDKCALIMDFLERYLFSYFTEAPYHVSLDAPLKPRYEGHASQVTPVSRSLVKRLAAEPERLSLLADVLKQTVPYFSTPIYIGSAKSLRARLQTHVRLMKQYREGTLVIEQVAWAELMDEGKADHSFAHEAVHRRQFDPNDLWVYTLPISIGDRYTYDIENVLNRIAFPLCGQR